jgi:hypothetical protein
MVISQVFVSRSDAFYTETEKLDDFYTGDKTLNAHFVM